MKKYFYLLACLGALTLCTACGDDDPIDEPDKGSTENPNGGNNSDNTTLPDGVNNNTLEVSIAASGQNASFAGGGLLFRLASHDDDFVSVCGHTMNRETFKGELTIPAYITVRGEKFKVTSIGSYAFSYKTGGITEDFGDCTSTWWRGLMLTKVSLPVTLTYIGDNAFHGCPLTSVVIPDMVTEIGESAFAFCYRITSVSLGKSVERIGKAAFSFCSDLTSITIPESVKIIEKQAFWSCTNLSTVTCKSETPPYLSWESYKEDTLTFEGDPFHEMVSSYIGGELDISYYNRNTKNLRVPWRSVSEYRNAGGWNEFENIQGF